MKSIFAFSSRSLLTIIKEFFAFSKVFLEACIWGFLFGLIISHLIVAEIEALNCSLLLYEVPVISGFV